MHNEFIDGYDENLFPEEEIHVTSAAHSLLPPSRAKEQGFEIDLTSDMDFTFSKNGRVVVVAKEAYGLWGFQVTDRYTKMISLETSEDGRRNKVQVIFTAGYGNESRRMT